MISQGYSKNHGYAKKHISNDLNLHNWLFRIKLLIRKL